MKWGPSSFVHFCVHRCNEKIHRKIQAATKEYDKPLTMVKKWKQVVWPHFKKRSFWLAEWKEKEVVDRRWDEKTILKNGQGRTPLAQLGQQKTGLVAKSWDTILACIKNFSWISWRLKFITAHRLLPKTISTCSYGQWTVIKAVFDLLTKCNLLYYSSLRCSFPLP